LITGRTSVCRYPGVELRLRRTIEFVFLVMVAPAGDRFIAELGSNSG